MSINKIKENIEKKVEEAHLEALGKSRCSTDIKEEMTVLPLGFLSTIVKEKLIKHTISLLEEQNKELEYKKILDVDRGSSDKKEIFKCGMNMAYSEHIKSNEKLIKQLSTKQ